MLIRQYDGGLIQKAAGMVAATSGLHDEAEEHFETALRRVNDSAYGLQAGVFTNDLRKARRAFHALEVGGVIINDYPTFRSDAYPYGGVKQSGLGREGVRAAMEELTEEWVLITRTQA